MVIHEELEREKAEDAAALAEQQEVDRLLAIQKRHTEQADLVLRQLRAQQAAEWDFGPAPRAASVPGQEPVPRAPTPWPLTRAPLRAATLAVPLLRMPAPAAMPQRPSTPRPTATLLPKSIPPKVPWAPTGVLQSSTRLMQPMTENEEGEMRARERRRPGASSTTPSTPPLPTMPPPANPPPPSTPTERPPGRG